MMTDRQYDLWKAVYLQSFLLCEEGSMVKVASLSAQMAELAVGALREADRVQTRINAAGWYEPESWPKGKVAQNHFAVESTGVGVGR